MPSLYPIFRYSEWQRMPGRGEIFVFDICRGITRQITRLWSVIHEQGLIWQSMLFHSKGRSSLPPLCGLISLEGILRKSVKFLEEKGKEKSVAKKV